MNFQHAKFCVLADFGAATFYSKANYSYSEFDESARFWSSSFLAGADFHSSIFSSGGDFNDTVFKEDASFSFTKFNALANFYCTIFQGDVHFNGSVFSGRADFYGSYFAQRSSFDLATFGDNTGFSKVIFGGNISFSSSIFKTSVSFQDVNFGGNVWMIETTFEGLAFFGPDFHDDYPIPTFFANEANFNRSIFKSTANFEYVRFKKSVVFDSCIFQQFSSFKETTFDDVASFSECQFVHPANFRRAHFVTHFPIFEGANLNQNPVFSADSHFWPKTEDAPAEPSRAALSIIRHSVGKRGLPEDEHYFYRQEMAFSGRIGNWVQRSPYRLFGIVSDYGWSIFRPTCALLILFTVGFVFYYSWLLWTTPMWTITHSLSTAIGFSFSQVFGIFGFNRLYFGFNFMNELPMSLKFLAAIQTVIGTVLVFFLGLGLRNRFRLR